MSIVSIVKVHNSRVDDAVRQAVDLIDGMSILTPGCKVLIKPNLVKPSPSGSGIITDARVTEAVVRFVLEHKPGRVYHRRGLVDRLRYAGTGRLADCDGGQRHCRCRAQVWLGHGGPQP